MMLHDVKAKAANASKDQTQDDSNNAHGAAKTAQKNAARDAASKVNTNPAPQPRAATKSAQKDAKSDPANDTSAQAMATDDNSAAPAQAPATDSQTSTAQPAPATAPDPSAQSQLALMAAPVSPTPANAPGAASDDESEGDPISIAGVPGKSAAQAAQAPAAPQIDAGQAAPQSAPQTATDSADDSDGDDKDAPAAAKAATPKNAARIPAQIADAEKSARTANDNTPRAAETQPQAAQPAPAQPAPQSQTANNPASNSGQTLHGIAAPSAPASSAAPADTSQAVHVAAQTTPTPNVSALAVQIAAKSQSGARQFDIRLDPPELGRVDVRLSIDATGKAQAHLTADQPQTLDLLQKDAPVLTRALREAGLDVSQNGLNFSLRDQAGANANAGSGGGQGRSRVTSLQAIKSIDAGTSTATWRGPIDGRLDIRV
jgi:flagellar hook-length control protein FliK